MFDCFCFFKKNPGETRPLIQKGTQQNHAVFEVFKETKLDSYYQGTFGVVSLIETANQKKYIKKQPNKRHKHAIACLENERDVLKHLSNLTGADKFVPLFISEHKSPLYMLMEFIEGCDMCDYVSQFDSYNKLRDNECMRIMLYLARALSFLHKNNVVHRDIHPGNVMISGEYKVEGVKIIDYGSSVIQSKKDNQFVVPIRREDRYVAPEVLCLGEALVCKDKRPIDVVCMAFTALIMFCFSGITYNGIGDDILQFSIYKKPADYPDQLMEGSAFIKTKFMKELLRGMAYYNCSEAKANLDNMYEKRLTAEEVVKHLEAECKRTDCSFRR